MRVLKRAMLTLPELVSVTGLSESHIRRQMRAGNLPSRLLAGRRRFLVADVEQALGVEVA